MGFFDEYVSNTLAGSGNQLFFDSDGVKTGRIFYKVFKGGRSEYSFLFSNNIDSTFYDGKKSHKNMVCLPWQILSLKVKVYDKDFFLNKSFDCLDRDDDGFKSVTFNGELSKNVEKGEIFYCDPILLEPKEDDYICIEITFKGEMIPYHEEIQIPTFVKKEDRFIADKKMPCLWCLGCKRKVDKKIAYFGDSITQGIGAPFNSYLHWNALLSKKIGYNNAYWNLGIGYGRADDGASDGFWLYKALQNDVVFLCFGVNDINRGFSYQQIIDNFNTIIDRLNEKNIMIILFTIPSFDYHDQYLTVWKKVNEYILSTLSKKVSKVIDIVKVVGKSEQESHITKYGGHPNEEGSRKWADYVFDELLSTKK